MFSPSRSLLMSREGLSSSQAVRRREMDTSPRLYSHCGRELLLPHAPSPVR